MTIGKVLQEAGKIELYAEVLGMQEKLLEMQKRIFELDTENKELRQKLELQESLVYENNSYWVSKDGKNDGPFCSRCWDVEKNIVRIKQITNNPSFHRCPECKTMVQTDPGYRPIFTSKQPPSSYI